MSDAGELSAAVRQAAGRVSHADTGAEHTAASAELSAARLALETALSQASED